MTGFNLSSLSIEESRRGKLHSAHFVMACFHISVSETPSQTASTLNTSSCRSSSWVVCKIALLGWVPVLAVVGTLLFIFVHCYIMLLSFKNTPQYKMIKYYCKIVMLPLAI